jgi:hypothetical protein
VTIQIELLGNRVHRLERTLKLTGRHVAPVDSNALGRFEQVWRRVQPGANARSAQRGFDHRASGSFSVGARDVHHTKRALGIPQRGQHTLDSLQAELGGLDLVAERVQEPDGIRVGHAVVVLGRLSRYTNQASAITASVPPKIFSSNSHTLVTSCPGTIEHASVISVANCPLTAATLRPAFHALAKM